MLKGNYLVKKSTPLIYAEWNSLGINEMKIVEVYLSRINIEKNITAVKFTKKDFAELMGYADSRNLKTKVFDERLAKFLSQQIKMDLDDGTGYHRFNLFSDAKCYFDPEMGMSMVEIDCNPKLAPVFIQLADGKNKGYRYISYRVDNTKNMESAYSIRLYNLLLEHAFGKFEWKVDLETLRTYMGTLESTYESFKYFNRLLKKVQKEIHECTDITFEYEKITKGRKTVALNFKIRKKNYKESKENKPQDIEAAPVVIDAEVKEVKDEVMEGQTSFFELDETVTKKKKKKEPIVVSFSEEHDILELKELIEEVNEDWRVTPLQLQKLNVMVNKHLVNSVTDFMELPNHRKSLIRMTFIKDVMTKAHSEEAVYLYKFLVTQWERYAAEISIDLDF